MSTITKCDICGGEDDAMGELILYAPGEKKQMRDICGDCREHTTINEAFPKKENR